MKNLRYAAIVMLWAIAVLLAVIYGSLIYVYLVIYKYEFPDAEFWTLCVKIGHSQPNILFLFSFFGLAICSCALVAHVCREKKWCPKRVWLWGVLVLILALPLVALMIDAPPVTNDYTRADIAPPSKKAEESYDVFMTYRKGKEPDFKIDAPHVSSLEAITNAGPYAGEIEKAWKDISAGRKYIEKLDSFEQIVDLTPGIQLDLKTPIINFLPIRSIAFVYYAYAVLKAEEGKPEEGVRHLVQLHSVCRKALPNCAILVSKMMWATFARCTIETAYLIATKPDCTPETLAILKAGFNPLTKEDTSIRRPLITEYLGMKYMCESYLTGTNLLDFFTMVEVGKEKPSPSFLKKMVSRIAFAFFFNRNRTVRECKEYYDQLITGASKCPPDISEPMTDWKMKMKRLRLGNPIGQMLVYIAIPYFSRTVETSSKLKVLSDLLAITLARRSGQELNLPDFYTGKAYIIDEKTGVAMSVGPDGLPGTEDDIKLGDWPWSPSRGSGR